MPADLRHKAYHAGLALEALQSALELASDELGLDVKVDNEVDDDAFNAEMERDTRQMKEMQSEAHGCDEQFTPHLPQVRCLGVRTVLLHSAVRCCVYAGLQILPSLRVR